WSGRSKPLFRLPVQKIHLIYSPRVEDVSDIKLIRTDTTLDLSQKAEKRYPTTALRRARRSGPRRAQPWWAGAEEGGKRGNCSMYLGMYIDKQNQLKKKEETQDLVRHVYLKKKKIKKKKKKKDFCMYNDKQNQLKKKKYFFFLFWSVTLQTLNGSSTVLVSTSQGQAMTFPSFFLTQNRN